MVGSNISQKWKERNISKITVIHFGLNFPIDGVTLVEIYVEKLHVENGWKYLGNVSEINWIFQFSVNSNQDSNIAKLATFDGVSLQKKWTKVAQSFKV